MEDCPYHFEECAHHVEDCQHHMENCPYRIQQNDRIQNDMDSYYRHERGVLHNLKHKLTRDEIIRKVRDILAAIGGITAALAGAALPPMTLSQPVYRLNNEVVVTNENTDNEEITSTDSLSFTVLEIAFFAQDVHDILESYADWERKRQEQNAKLSEQMTRLVDEIKMGVELSPTDSRLQDFREFILQAVQNGKTVDEAYQEYEEKMKKQLIEELIKMTDEMLGEKRETFSSE